MKTILINLMDRRYLVFVFFLITLSVKAQTNTTQKTDFNAQAIDNIQNKISDYLTKMEKIGYYGSVLVEINKEKIISRGYGFQNRKDSIRNTKQTIFDIGSITKQFTATAILKLEMGGKLSVNDKISKYFPGAPIDKQNITIHDLLRHQSGLISNVGKDFEKITDEEFLEKVFTSKLRFDVGTSFSYSNVGYSLLTIIIEKVSGKTYETYLYENLWKPAKMEMTGYKRPKFDPLKIASGYDRFEKPWGSPLDKEWDKTAPYLHLKGNGGILSTTEDMFKWHKALMTNLILNKEATDKLYHPAIREGEDYNSIYAYGWDVSITGRNTTRVTHNGTNRIFFSDFVRFIDEEVCIITLSNKAHPDFNGVATEISRIIFEDKYRPEIPVIDNEENRAFTKKIIGSLETSGLEKTVEAYNARKKNTNVLEFEMREAGFDNLDNKKPGLAVLIFEFNTFAHPLSSKASQGLAEGYMETGQKDQAIINFKRCLLLNPDNRFAKDMLVKLENE